MKKAKWGVWWAKKPVAVVPIDDEYPHSPYSENCNCNPYWDNSDGARVLIHNSFDGREKFEYDYENAEA